MDAGFGLKLDTAWKSLASWHGLHPTIGIILGSGLGHFARRAGGAEVPFSAITGFPRPTVQGHSGTFHLGDSLAVMAGRVHYYEGHPIDDVVLPVFLLHRLGVRTLIVTNAAGGVNRAYKVGDLVLIRDHVNLMGINPLRGPNPGDGPRFPDMSTTYHPDLRAVAQAAARGAQSSAQAAARGAQSSAHAATLSAGAAGAALHEGVYAAFSGPTYETPAEIRMLAAIGADLVGMSTVPEVIAAAYLGIRVLGISCVTNMAAGILPQPLAHEEVIRAGKEAAPRFTALLEGVVSGLGGALSGA